MFRYDHRYENDGQRLAALVQATVGKRLMYKRPVPKAGQGLTSTSLFLLGGLLCNNRKPSDVCEMTRVMSD